MEKDCGIVYPCRTSPNEPLDVSMALGGYWCCLKYSGNPLRSINRHAQIGRNHPSKGGPEAAKIETTAAHSGSPSPVSLPPAAGGLGLVNVAAHYQALTSSIMIWTSLNDPHLVRQILQGHIKEVSMKRWGTQDLAWIVSKCGTLKMPGSSRWQNICRGWGILRKKLLPMKPVNNDEWRALPLWRLHVNHINPVQAWCSSSKLHKI